MAERYHDTPHAPTERDENRAVGARKHAPTPLGRQIWQCVRGKGTPCRKFLDLALRDASDATHVWHRQMTEALTERSTSTGELLQRARRDIESPTARDIMAVYMMLLEHENHGMVNSRSLWHGHKKAGKGGGMGGRLGGACAEWVSRCLDCLCNAGAIKRWQADPGTAGVVKNAEGQCYQSYLLFHVPAAIRRLIRTWRVRHKQRATTPPDALPSRPSRQPPPDRWADSEADDARSARALLARMLAADHGSAPRPLASA